MDSKPDSPEGRLPPAVPPRKKAYLPFRSWWPLLAGVLTGIALRLVFSGKPGDMYAAMMGSFVYLAPVLVGAVTVYVAERSERRSWGYYFWAPFIANALFVCGTLLIMIEGLICAILIVPLFSLFGAIGGLIMGVVCRVTKWPKQTLMSFAALPLVLGWVEADVALPHQWGAVERVIVVDAMPEAVWKQILHAGDVQADKVERAWAFRIGVPAPVAGVTRRTPAGPVRRVTMGKRVYFDEIITDWQEPRFVRWTYRFYEDSVPPDALDDHVMIGGHYFDLIDTSYTLTPLADRTEIKVRISYRVSTQFNWYADALAQLLLGNVAEVNLGYYASRSLVR